jgi:hypothetical protein
MATKVRANRGVPPTASGLKHHKPACFAGLWGLLGDQSLDKHSLNQVHGFVNSGQPELFERCGGYAAPTPSLLPLPFKKMRCRRCGRRPRVATKLRRTWTGLEEQRTECGVCRLAHLWRVDRERGAVLLLRSWDISED